MMKNISNAILAMSLGALLIISITQAGCGSDDGEGNAAPGTLKVTVYGEEFIEDGIPASAFVDGWALSFEQFLVTVSDIGLARESDSAPLLDSTARVFDLAKSSDGDGHLVLSEQVPGGAYSVISYKIAPPSSTNVVGGNITDDDANFMSESGYSIFATGFATKGETTKTFAWGWDTITEYAKCAGTAVVDGDEQTTELTIHADHLFYDDLVSEEPNVAFDLIASADTNGDDNGDVTLEELADVDITGEANYQVGSNPVTDLRAFIEFQTRTLGHIDGEGHCTTASP